MSGFPAGRIGKRITIREPSVRYVQVTVFRLTAMTPYTAYELTSSRAADVSNAVYRRLKADAAAHRVKPGGPTAEK